MTAHQNQPKTTISAAPQAASSASPRQLETILVDDEIKSKQPGRNVFHNPEIEQALHIDLVKTFNFVAKVYCVKFSPDGKYLAVGLDKSGKTYIYDVEKGLFLWLALLLTIKANALC
jgi:WD40 repeat protein